MPLPFVTKQESSVHEAKVGGISKFSALIISGFCLLHICYPTDGKWFLWDARRVLELMVAHSHTRSASCVKIQVCGMKIA